MEEVYLRESLHHNPTALKLLKMNYGLRRSEEALPRVMRRIIKACFYRIFTP